MPNYMLFLHSDSTRPRPASPDEIMKITKAYMAWADRMRSEGRLKGGEKLTFESPLPMDMQELLTNLELL